MTPRTLSWQGALSGKCGIFFKDEACGDSMGLCVLALVVDGVKGDPLPRALSVCATSPSIVYVCSGYGHVRMHT
jgi:hypothetical protein